ncbi:MAG: hypothetical protein MHM6MM_004469 [Cercozoa sp. M6MM]
MSLARVLRRWRVTQCRTVTAATSEPRGERQFEKPPEASTAKRWWPRSLDAYARLARLDRPVGTWLLLWPALWSQVMAMSYLSTCPTTASLSLGAGALMASKLCAGAFLMRGAGCTVNDMWDRDFDKRVERCRARPLAAGELSMKQAWAFLALQLSASFGILCTFDAWTIASGFLACPLAMLYPAAKRYVSTPQVALALPFAFGALFSWAAVLGEAGVPLWAHSVLAPMSLYASASLQTVFFDTIYGHQDKKDDARLGLKSTALTFGDKYTKPILSVLGALSVGSMALAGHAAGFGSVFQLISTGGLAAHQAWQLYSVDLADEDSCGDVFRSNTQVGPLVLAGMLGDIATQSL